MPTCGRWPPAPVPTQKLCPRVALLPLAPAAGRPDHTWLSARCGVCFGHAWCREPFPFQEDEDEEVQDAASSHVRSLTTRGPVRVRVGLGLGPSVGVCAHTWLYVLLKPTRGPGFRLPPPQPQPHMAFTQLVSVPTRGVCSPAFTTALRMCPRVALLPPPPRRWARHLSHTWPTRGGSRCVFCGHAWSF